MNPYRPIRIVLFLVAGSIALNAQASRQADPVPLKKLGERLATLEAQLPVKMPSSVSIDQ